MRAFEMFLALRTYNILTQMQTMRLKCLIWDSRNDGAPMKPFKLISTLPCKKIRRRFAHVLCHALRAGPEKRVWLLRFGYKVT